MRRIAVTALLMLLTTVLPVAAAADNPELAQLYRADQAARENGAGIDWTVVSKEDAARRDRVRALLREGAITTAADYHHAAMVFQHGQGLDAIRMAHALATLAAAQAPDEVGYRWLVAASWDRIMATQLQPQWYGTQYQGSGDGLFLYPVAEGAVDDAERARSGVPSLAEARSQVTQMSARTGEPARKVPPTIEQLRVERRAAGAAAP